MTAKEQDQLIKMMLKKNPGATVSQVGATIAKIKLALDNLEKAQNEKVIQATEYH